MHAIAFGKRLFGKVDRAAGGRYHVATLCWHFCYLPLVPLGTYLVVREEMRGMTTHFRGVRIPFSPKSWAVAWVRTLLTMLFLPMAFVSVVLLAVKDRPVDRHNWGLLVAWTAAVGLLLFVPYRVPGIGRATRSRGEELDGRLNSPATPPSSASAVQHVFHN